MTSRQHRLQDLLPVILPLLLILAFGWYHHGISFNDRLKDQHTAPLIVWAASAVCLTALLMLLLGLSTSVVVRALATSSAGGRLLAIISIASFVGLAVYQGECGKLVPTSASQPEKVLVNPTADVEALVHHNNLFALLVIVAAVGAATAVGRRIDALDEKQLSSRLESLRLLLTVSALTLAAGVLEITALFRYWALASTTTDYEGLDRATAIAIAAGLLFSLLLLLVFGPAVVRLEQRFKSLAARAAEEAAKTGERFSLDQWSVRHGLTGSPLHTAELLIKFFLPLLAGLASALSHSYFKGAG